MSIVGDKTGPFADRRQKRWRRVEPDEQVRVREGDRFRVKPRLPSIARRRQHRQAERG